MASCLSCVWVARTVSSTRDPDDDIDSETEEGHEGGGHMGERKGKAADPKAIWDEEEVEDEVN